MFGNTPIQLLHDAFAHHKDYSSKQTNSNDKTQIGQRGFHCECDHFVVESAFVIPAVNSHFVSILLSSEFSSSITRSLFFQTSSFFQLRGPPVKA